MAVSDADHRQHTTMHRRHRKYQRTAIGNSIKNMTSIFFSLQAILSENIEMFKFLAKDSFKVYFYNDPIIQMLVIIIIMFISKTEESLLTYVSYF